MQIATKTLKLLEDAVARDGGNAYRVALGKVMPHIGDAYREDEDPFRTHMGASGIGAECGRAIWYGFRWFHAPKFTGRLLRLFNRGHMEEGRFIALLLAAGISVYQQDDQGRQFRISVHGGHFGGSGDGIVVGIPDLPEGETALSEFKTHNDKSFQKLLKEGVKVSKPQHYIQMQMYLHRMNLKYAVYFAVNKNDDTIHAEIIANDGYTAHQFETRAGQLIYANSPPPRISDKPSWYVCKWCDLHSICHKGAIPEVNCRTCIYATPLHTGEWHCRQHNAILTKQEQLEACAHYQRFV